ncbi:MAG: AEC family transporter [Acidobacteriota bacterium]
MTIILNSIFPVCVLMALGHCIKRYEFVNEQFFRASDKLIYYIFFPVMLFWEIGRPDGGGTLDWRLGAAIMLAVLSVSLLSLAYTKLTGAPDFCVGSFSQCCYRYNAYVGLAIVLSVFGKEGVRHYGTVMFFSIPFINVLAVSTLIWFSGRSIGRRERLQYMVKALVSNPLIAGCAAGFLYSKIGPPFPTFLDNTFKMLSSISLPLALLSIGSALDTSKLKDHFRLAAVSSAAKLILLPVVGYAFLRALQVSGPAFGVAMIFFSLPTATSIYILSSQLNSDVDMASAGIVLSTVLSIASLSASLLLFGG